MQSSRARIEGESAPGGGGRGGMGAGALGASGRGGAGGGAAPVQPAFPAPSPTAVLSTVPPGEYRVVLVVGGKEYAQPALVIAE
jgi:hypothetical protein